MPEVQNSTPFVWTAGRGGLERFVAHVLIRLLILAPLPPHAQLTAALFPLSLAWPFLAAAAPAGPSENPGTHARETPAESPLSDSLGRGCEAAVNRVWEPGMSGVGGRIALTDANLLLSTSGSFIVDPDDPLRGIHATALDVVGAIAKPKPTFTRPVAGKAAAAQEETTKDIPIRIRVYPPDTEVASASLALFNDGTPVGAPIPLVMTGGTAIYSLAKGFVRAVGATTLAVFDFFTSDGRRVTARKVIPAGRLIVRVDSDNDTKMGFPGSLEDVDDKQAAEQGKAFAFWGRDVTRKGENALIDYARVSIRREGELDPDARVALKLRGCTWEVHRRINVRDDFAGQIPLGCQEDGKLQFCDSGAVSRQLEIIESTDPKLVFSGPGDTKEIPAQLLRKPQIEALFRVTPACSGASEMEVLEILPNGTLGEPLNSAKIEIQRFSQLSSMLSLRGSLLAPPLTPEAWKDPHYQVAPQAQQVPGWTPLSEKLDAAKQITLIVHGYAVSNLEFTAGTADWASEFETVAKRLYWAGHPILETQDAARVVGVSWPGDIPGGMNPFMQEILGTDAVRPLFQEDEFNAFLSGIPLAEKLQQLRDPKPGRKVNILAHSLGNLVVNSALQRLVEGQSSGAPINYLMLQAAITSEAFLRNYNPLNFVSTNGVKDLIEHAQDLGFPSAGQPRIDQKWLNQENEVFQRLREFPTPYTCSTSGAPVVINPDCGPGQPPGIPPWQCDATRCSLITRFLEGYGSVFPSAVATDFSSPPTQPSYFNTRWGKLEPNDDGTRRGAWTRLFRTNITPAQPTGIRVFNAYNPGDFILRIDRPYHEGLPDILDAIFNGWFGAAFAQLRSSRLHAWKALQILSKPFSPSTEAAQNRILDMVRLGGADDSLGNQKWWTLEIEGRPSPWQSTVQIPSWALSLAGADRAWIRQRAELAMWYPAMAAPAGVVPLEGLDKPILGSIDLPVQGSNINMLDIGGQEGTGDFGTGGTPSHSYHVVKGFHKVWKGFRAFRTVFAQ